MTRINHISFKEIDPDEVYAQCSGPGGLRLARFMAGKMGLRPGAVLLDAGCNRGIQTCFLAREYGVRAVGIDPWDDRMDGRPMVEHLRENADKYGVSDSVLGLRAGLPNSGFASASFDFVYSTTALEMIRVLEGDEGYLKCLKEIERVLKPGGIFGLGEPMHLDVPLPPDLEPYVSQDEFPWKECFRDIHATVRAVAEAGFEITRSGYAPEARDWWMEYAEHDPFCKLKPEEDPRTLEADGGRWVSFGYVTARKKPTI